MKKTTTRSSAERIFDRAIELTFLASDPIAVTPNAPINREGDVVATAEAI